MENSLSRLIAQLESDYRQQLAPGGRHYLEVDIGRLADTLGYADLSRRYRQTCAIVPLVRPGCGMKVRIDGRTFVGYGQFDSGVAVPASVARASGRPYTPFQANDSMVLNFA